MHVVALDIAEESPYLEIEDKENDSPEILFENQELRQELDILVARLPERYRVAITCYYFEHLSYQEIAELLDQSIGTVKSTIFRGIRQLRGMVSTTEQEQEGREYHSWNMRRTGDRKA